MIIDIFVRFHLFLFDEKHEILDIPSFKLYISFLGTPCSFQLNSKLNEISLFDSFS